MSSLPTGTVTFLFTDIQGSTRLWEQHPDAMPTALARHDALLRGCIEDRQGYVFKTVGDAFCAAFPTANGALEAALAAQFAFAAEPWDTAMPISVRMALHTGACEERGGDYFGQPLNCVARLMAAGHGGQVLLSEVTHGLVRDAMPPSTSLLDLSQHRLKDLGRPEQVFQLLHPSLPAGFPPLRSLDNPALPNNLPQQLTSFIGREKQITEVKKLLENTRLLTLVGAGGSGKTRLSLQAAAELLDGVGDGVWLVEFAPLSDPALVPQAVADVLGIKEQAGTPLLRTLTDALKAKRLLLVLDNCEHVVAACASLAADLLRCCPSIHLLATSREPLNVAGEQTYRVPSLSLPDPKRAQTGESLSQFEAVRLFIERAQTVQPSFTVTDRNAPAVAQVCFRLDGIPLALELAAARVRSLPVEEVNTRLDQRFRLLTGGSRTALPRQQTLRALIDWSYDLLTDREKTLLRRLSVFAGGWTLAAAEIVCSGEAIEDWEVLDLLTSLTDKSLVMYQEEGAGSETGRFRLLESVRQYAGDRLEESGEGEALGGRQAVWFLALAEAAVPHWRGSDEAVWLSRLEAEHDNLRASLSWYERQAHREEQGAASEAAENGLHLSGALHYFWEASGYISEGRQWLGRALANAGDRCGTAVRARAFHSAGGMAMSQGDLAEAQTLLAESLALYRQIGDQKDIPGPLCNLAMVAMSTGDYAEARVLIEESLLLSTQLGDLKGIAFALANLGYVAMNIGDHVKARVLHKECLALYREAGDQIGIALALNSQGIAAAGCGDYVEALALQKESLVLLRRLGDQTGIAWGQIGLGDLVSKYGNYTEARVLTEESLALFQQLEDQRGIAYALSHLGLVALSTGDYAEARARLAECLFIRRQIGSRGGPNIYCFEGMAHVAYHQRHLSRAAGLLGVAAALRDSVASLPVSAEQEETDRWVSSVREGLGEEAYSAAWDAGRAMTWEQAVEYALSKEEPPGGRSPGQ